MNEYSQKPMLSRKEREKLRNREAILEAAVHVFAQKGFNETKLEEVAALAEFGKGTLYNYFENKNDLLMSALDFALGKVKNYLDEQLVNMEDPLERIRIVVKAHFEYYNRHGDFLRVVLSNQKIISQRIREAKGRSLYPKMLQLKQMMIREIQSAIDAQLLKSGDATRYASYLTGMIHHQVRSLHNEEIKLEEVNPDEIVDIFLYGVSHA